MTQPMTCPKCSGHMEAGFILDRGAGAANAQAKWLEGVPTPSFWPGDRVKMQGRRPLPVITFRCDGCGYLESFATEHPET